MSDYARREFMVICGKQRCRVHRLQGEQLRRSMVNRMFAALMGEIPADELATLWALHDRLSDG